MMNTAVAFYPRVTAASLADPHQSGGSPKHKEEDVATVQNVGKLDTQGEHVVIPVLISTPTMKGMLCLWRICWMVHGSPVVGRNNVTGMLLYILEAHHCEDGVVDDALQTLFAPCNLML